MERLAVPARRSGPERRQCIGSSRCASPSWRPLSSARLVRRAKRTVQASGAAWRSLQRSTARGTAPARLLKGAPRRTRHGPPQPPEPALAGSAPRRKRVLRAAFSSVPTTRRGRAQKPGQGSKKALSRRRRHSPPQPPDLALAGTVRSRERVPRAAFVGRPRSAAGSGPKGRTHRLIKGFGALSPHYVLGVRE